jgi:hypothetical protein
MLRLTLRFFFEGVGGICIFMVMGLGIGIYIHSALLAYSTDWVLLILTLIFPVLAQVFWIVFVWKSTGTLFHSLTIECLTWLVLLTIALASITLARRLASPGNFTRASRAASGVAATVLLFAALLAYAFLLGEECKEPKNTTGYLKDCRPGYAILIAKFWSALF